MSTVNVPTPTVRVYVTGIRSVPTTVGSSVTGTDPVVYSAKTVNSVPYFEITSEMFSDVTTTT